AVVAAPAAAAEAVLAAAPRLEARAPLFRVTAALLRGRLDLGHDQVVLRPLHRDLLADELLDALEVQRAGLVHQRDGLAAGAGPPPRACWRRSGCDRRLPGAAGPAAGRISPRGPRGRGAAPPARPSSAAA